MELENIGPVFELPTACADHQRTQIDDSSKISILLREFSRESHTIFDAKNQGKG